MGAAEWRARIVAVAREYVGTPYHHAGRVKGVGVDCAQLLIAVYSEAGLIEPFDPGHYVTDFALHRSEEVFRQWVSRYAVQTASALPGDVLLFRYGRCYSHGAIVVDDRLMIHAFIGRGVEMVEREEFSDRPQIAYSLLQVRNVRA